MPLNAANGQFDLVEQFAMADLYGDLVGYFKAPSAPPHYVDNGDGTITDNTDRADVGEEAVEHRRALHELEAARPTCAACRTPTPGAAYLAEPGRHALHRLSGEAQYHGDGRRSPAADAVAAAADVFCRTTATGGFPTIDELRPFCSSGPCSTSPCIDPIFGPTQIVFPLVVQFSGERSRASCGPSTSSMLPSAEPWPRLTSTPRVRFAADVDRLNSAATTAVVQ